MKKLIVGTIVLLLAGCAQLNQMSVFSVNDKDVENLLAGQLSNLTRQVEVAGVPAKMSVDKMNVSIGPDNSDKVRLDTSASAALSLFGLTYPANMKLVIEGAPYYDAKQHAVYVRSVKLLDSSVEASGYRGNLSAVSNELLQVVNQFLQTNPVYKLDLNDPKQKMLSQVPLNMSVQQGRINFTPAL